MSKYDIAPTVAAGLVRTARDRADLTQSELARQAGVSQQTISAYETGRKEPTLPTLQRLLAAAGFEMRILLEPESDHDQSLAEFIDTLPSAVRATIESRQRERVAAARLDRIRGH